MKDIVQDRINRMEDLEQRKQLKNMMTGVFLNLAEYQEEMQRNLEDRIFNEIGKQEERQDLYVTLCSRQEIDPIHEFLYPMLAEDVAPPIWDAKAAFERFNNGEDVRLQTVFFACDYAKLRTLVESKRTFQGIIVTSHGRHSIEVIVRQNRKYLDEIEKLYHVFLKNGMPWKTVNHPYAYKFFDVLCANNKVLLGEDEAILEISVDFEEFEHFKHPDVIPLWNIERLEISTSGFPVPAIDKINYEHVLSIKKMGTAHGYLVDGEESDIHYIKRMPNELIIVSPIDDSRTWDVFKITQPIEIKIGSFEYELVSNRRKNSFVTRFAGYHNGPVRTKGEMIRIVNSFEAADMFKLEGIDIFQEVKGFADTYEMNTFVSDHVRVEQNKKVMQLTFRSLTERSFIVQDTISFLVSEVQRHFPDYKCQGVII